jgi:hypothetical protein
MPTTPKSLKAEKRALRKIDQAAEMMKPYAGAIEAWEVGAELRNVRNNRPQMRATAPTIAWPPDVCARAQRSPSAGLCRVVPEPIRLAVSRRQHQTHAEWLNGFALLCGGPASSLLAGTGRRAR